MAAARGRVGVGSELDEALVRAGRYLRKGVASADLRTLQKSGGREADSFYRDRWSYDKVVRSAHGVNCTDSCSWKVCVKDGIITWGAQQTDYPSAGLDRPDYERGGARAVRRSPGTPARRPGSAVPTCGVLLELFREARACRGGDPVEVWAEIAGNPGLARRYKSVRGKGGLVRRAGMRRWSSRRSRTCRRSAPGSGPDGRAQRDPGDEHGQPCRGRLVPRADRRADAVVLRLLRRPAGRLLAGLR
jgi:hypothetical protein